MEGKDGRTERATPKRRREERRKGNLCVSQEVNSLLVLLLGALALRFAAPLMLGGFAALLAQATRFQAGRPWTVQTVQGAFTGGSAWMAPLLAALFVPVLAAAVVGNMMQTSPYFSMKALKFSLNGLNPAKGLKRLVSVQALVQLGLGLAKVALVAGSGWVLCRSDLPVVMSLHNVGVAEASLWVFTRIFRLTMLIALVFVVIAVLDWCIKKRQYERRIMMTKQEVKEERREHEPNPAVRRAMAKRMRSLSLARMMSAVPNANVVITNPDHVAVAIEYDAASMSAPRVTAKGLRLMAERIKQVAREHGVPVVRRPETARALYRNVDVGQSIPAGLFKAVAEVLAYLHKLGRNVGLRHV